MNPWIALPVAVVAAAATSFAVVSLSHEEAAPKQAPTVAASVPEAWKSEHKNERLERDLALLRQSLETRTPVDANVDDAALDRAVARFLAAKNSGAVVAQEATVEAAQSAKPFADVNAAIAKLAAASGYEAREPIWKAIRDAGLLDEVVAEYERRAEADPKNPDLHSELGSAYIQKIFASSQGPESGKWAMKADGAFDHALELDPQHWEARYSKAISLSFWPPIFGKQAEAIHNFEILVEQQSHGPSAPQFANTHLCLGNLYQQSGQMDKAKAAWQQGLALFPDDAELKQKLELAAGG
ncbi:MAG: tetratricopeptide repeat protein [Planctomycetes bacterium]|nr:tetratricopeptide repeat protein [Planctomycetota bacterium]